MKQYGMNNNGMRQVDMSKKNDISGKIGYGGVGVGSYSNTLKTNVKPSNSKYSLSELEEAKNMTKGLGGKPSNMGSGLGSTGNYRKAFKPFDNNSNSNTNNFSSKVTTKPGFVKSQPQSEENYIVERPKQSSGVGSYNKLNFAQKYNNPTAVTSKTGGGSYTNSKLAKNTSNTMSSNTNYDNYNNTNMQSYNNVGYGKTNQPTNSSNYKQTSSSSVDNVDNLVAKNTRR